MVMLDWEHENFLRLTRMNMWERDLRLVLWLLWMMPLLEPKEMERITGFSENRCYKVLRELSKRRLVIREAMGRSGGKRFRYWLTRKGVLLVAEETRCPIAWQVTETGVGWLIRRLPMVEAFYALAPKLMRHEGVKVDLPVILTTDPDGSGTTTEFTPEMKIYDFCWMSEGEIHAVVRFENKAWFPLVWVGSMVPEHQLIEKGKIAVQRLDARFEPAGWAIVGFDRLAASLAAEFWPADNVLAVSTDGHIERKMHPGAFTSTALREEAKPARLGRPENVANWWRKTSNQYKPEMVALNSKLNYSVFRFIAEWQGPTPAQLERRFGTSYRAAVRALKAAGLVVKLDSAFYLDERGELTVARMDRVSHQLVAGRMDTYLKEDGAYRQNQQRHNRSLIDVVQTLSDQDVGAYGGWRTRRTAPDGTQIVPDAAVRLEWRDDPRYIVFLELEFTARTPQAIRRKWDTYGSVHEQQGKPIRQLWLLEDTETEEKFRRARGFEPALTAVLDEFLKSKSSVWDDVWRIDNDRVPLSEIIAMEHDDCDMCPWHGS